MIIKTRKAPFEVEVLTVDDMLTFLPGEIADLTDLQIITIMRWWQGCGDERFNRERENEMLGYDPDLPNPSPSRGPGIVYLVRRSDGQVKIGYTRAKKKRYIALASQHGERLEILGELETDAPEKLENQLHRDLWGYRVTGEWFALPQAEIDQILRRN